jgi:tetratricopeptide (TPR) repeat protein
MPNRNISTQRILEKLDLYLDKNDYASAERHLLYWLDEAKLSSESRVELMIRNELMGLYRKTGREREALDCVASALALIESLDISQQIGAATTFLNSATVYKAFGRAEESFSLFLRARAIYETELDPYDSRLGGLYNNMALTLVDLRRFSEADELYKKAIEVMSRKENGELEVAITYLNMASAAEARYGLEDSEQTVTELLDSAEKILDGHKERNGYYAFVCEKCASVFEYYGRFFYAKDLKLRAERIYTNEGS